MTEPLLSKNIHDLLRLTKFNGHISKLTTNGFLLEKKAESINEYIDYLQVSIDGPKQIHDSNRGNNYRSSRC